MCFVHSKGSDHLAGHDGERHSYIVLLCCPRCLLSEGGQVPLEKSHEGAVVGCLRLPTLHFRKSDAPLDTAMGFPSSPSKLGVEESHDPGYPTNPRPVQCDPIDPIHGKPTV